jgi:adenylate cyclase
VDLAPSNHLAQQVLAVARFFRKETAACRSAAERALALNPLDGSNEAIFILCFLGDWERGRALIRRSMELNPHHPRWYLHVLALDEYRKGNYREAVQEVIRANLPDLYWSDFLLAAAYGQLGELADARKALEAITGHWNDLEEPIETGLAKWYEPELCEHLIEGLRKAGLELGESGR